MNIQSFRNGATVVKKPLGYLWLPIRINFCMTNETISSRIDIIMEKEVRNLTLEVRSIPESRTVEGYALVFNSESRDLGGFTEIIEPTALEGVLEKSDVLCLLNHDESRGILARNNKGVGSL